MQETLKNIKHQFFAFRNGIVADALRKQYGYRMVFGLQIPQIAEIARQFTPSTDLAETLWAENGNRESRLLATYLFPLDEMDMDKALKLASEAQTVEESDMLAFRIFKRLPFAEAIYNSMADRPDISSYTRAALKNHLK